MTLYREWYFPNCKKSWWKSYFCRFQGERTPQSPSSGSVPDTASISGSCSPAIHVGEAWFSQTLAQGCEFGTSEAAYGKRFNVGRQIRIWIRKGAFQVTNGAPRPVVLKLGCLQKTLNTCGPLLINKNT